MHLQLRGSVPRCIRKPGHRTDGVTLSLTRVRNRTAPCLELKDAGAQYGNADLFDAQPMP